MGKPLVLVVDDEALIALDMESTLSEAGFAVALAATCSQAKRFLADHTPAAAILDVRLSDGEAVDAAKTLAGRAVPFIVYSGLGLEETPEAFSSGVRVMKPAGPPEVVRALKAMTAGQQKATG
ncbi:response regulator [Mesorhizobium sp. L103C131B0]|uniref:response regulator n=1 Tax=Mesorhizobium sp. L103C131B0 TaxID=1287089 RepID=UPI0003CFE27F|nr:response regulator [Mesorhizobium sp. L103C131B0]ESZ65845.1 hisitidine kinase [Mesorhizobium sp. L103C131B0]